MPLSSLKTPAFGDVVSRELPVLYRVARRLTLNDALAEDLVGNTLVIAHGQWSSFDGAYPRSWLIALLRNEWNNLRRREHIRSTVDLDTATEPSDEGFWCEINIRLDAETLISAIDRLPEEYRLAVVLCDVEEVTYEEAAKALGVPVGTIRSRLFRGRKILRSSLASLKD